MTNKPYATNYSEEDEKKLTDLEAELATLIASFRDCLDQEPWVYPAVMKRLREAGDSISSKVKELHKWQRKIYPGERISLTPDPLSNLPQNRIGVHPDCEKGFKLSH